MLIFCCAAVGVGDVSNNIIGLFEHPVVAPGDGVMWVDGLNPLREHSVGVVVVFRLLAGHIGQCIEPRIPADGHMENAAEGFCSSAAAFY